MDYDLHTVEQSELCLPESQTIISDGRRNQPNKTGKKMKKDPKDVLREEMLEHPGLAAFFQQVQNVKIEIKGKVALRMLVDDFIENRDISLAIDELDLEHSRCCSECGKAMYEGYCIENGAEYYCSEECLHKNLTDEEYENLYDEGRGDSYWTSWID